MPMISDGASAVKSRFGFHQSSSEPDLIRSSPAAFLKSSASKEGLLQMSDGEKDDFVESERSLNHSFELQEDPSFWKDHNVQVIIRIRPLSSSEISLHGNNKCIRQDGYQTLTWTGHPESRFTFDLVADENVTQEKLFKVAGLPMVENCMEGYNSCMFAYGQTGSGKTHTMLGDIDGGTRRHSVNCGMTPRVFEHLFSRIQKEKEIRRDEKLRFICKCSFLEIYNEQILDLLDPSSVNLQIREDSRKGVYVENLKELEVSSARDVMQQLIQGAANRKVAATNMNRASSRSHSVFTCIIESKWESQGVTHHRFSRLNLVDLAGSERQKSSGAEGERLKEATNINKSLSTLGLVIMNLVSISNGKSLHVPYRDSKLTFLLQDSLGGNSKTIIIANISPSSCCSLETLSTLKFAQRAKYIKNNAIVNEDASGDVLAMRLQIQQLKKEVSRLRGMVNGEAENQENDNLSICFPGSPGSFKWEGLQGSFSPLISDKKKSQKKEYEAALVAAFRREMDKEAALQALTAENKAAMHLAKQREDEIQGLKMRLRFREAGIKRLEAVASGKISAETHLLQEKEEHLKEIEVLRNQVDRNQEVTRFAMENLRLKEELRRLKSFHEEGEREQMNEQIMILQNKLLEALDWKLMHESDPGILQKANLDMVNFSKSEDKLLITDQDPSSPWRSSINEENEFLQLQAIQNQRELDRLQKKLHSSLEEKEKLERHIEGLVLELEEEKKLKRNVEEQTRQQLQIEAPDHPFDAAFNDQMELKTMVDAIAAASQREAEAHERAITLAKENDELRMKLKFLIEDNNKLIELYEGAVAENKKFTDCHEAKTADLTNEKTEDQMTHFHEDDDMDRTRKIESLESQLQEMHEENEKLMGLYEKAMQERDEYKRMFCSSRHDESEVKEEFHCPEKLVEVDGGESFDCSNELASRSCVTNMLVDPVGFSGLTGLDESCVCTEEATPIIDVSDQNAHGNAVSNAGISDTETMPSKLMRGISEEVILVRDKLENAQAKLASATEALTLFGVLEKTSIEVDMLSKAIEVAEKGILVKQRHITSFRNCHTDIQQRKSTVAKKFAALNSSISSFSSSISYWEQREDRARARMDSSSASVEQKKDAMSNLQARMKETEIAQQKAQQCEIELRNQLSCLKSKLQEDEIQKKESEKVLFTIDNFDIKDVPAHRNWQQFGGKATELLKSEEERRKLQTEMKQCRENLSIVVKEIEDLQRKSNKLETEKQALEKEIMSGLESLKELELGFDQVLKEREMILEMAEKGKDEIGFMIIEYHQCVFELELKEGEIKILEEELQVETSRRNELRDRHLEGVAKFSSVKESNDQQHQYWSLTQKMEEQLQEVKASVLEARSLLGDRTQNISHT